MALKIFNVINRGIRVSDGIVAIPKLISDAGVFFPEYGGYYAGANIVVGGKEYAVIIAPKSGGEATRLIKTSETSTSGSFSLNDGKANMDLLVSKGISNFPAAEFCYNLNLNGFTDWHMPSHDELEIAYRYLKPSTQNNDNRNYPPQDELSGVNYNSNPTGSAYTLSNPSQTNVTDFQSGNSESFDEVNYLASYLLDSGGTPACAAQRFDSGLQAPRLILSGSQKVRAVRWVEV